MPDFAHERIVAKQSMPRVFILNDRMSLRQAIDELLFLDEYSEPNEWKNLVVYLPL